LAPSDGRRLTFDGRRPHLTLTHSHSHSLSLVLRSFARYPSTGSVDFRASCFCHQKLIDTGYVCSVCLSVFCAQTETCTTCDAKFGDV
jgi:hypothetical protein